MNRSKAFVSLIGVIILNLFILSAAQDPVFSLNCTSSKQTYDPEKKQCVSCPAPCEDCAWSFKGGAPTCNRCPDNFFYKIEKDVATCTACAAGCKKCRGPEPDDCIEANPYNNKYNPDKKQLIKCETSNCQYCDEAGLCQVCEPGYRLDDKKVCVSCPSGCGVCAKLGEEVVCQQCLASQRLVISNGKADCEGCGSGCAACHSPSQCLFCRSDYLLFNGRCYSMSNCEKIKDEKSCEKCKPEYFVEGSGSCARCDEGCQECTGKGACGKCSPGYALNDQKTCTKCPDRCTTCDGTGACTKCQPRYFPTADKKACKDNCQSSCDECTDEKTCTKCSWDSVKIGTECKTVSSVCSKSGEGVNGLDGQGTCASYLEDKNLLFCSKADLTSTPKRCVDPINQRYIYDTKNGKVVNCPAGCASCMMTAEGAITCTATRLADYLTIAEDPTTKSAVLSTGCPKGCATCTDDLTKCLTCTIGYRLHISLTTGSQVCVTKDAPCTYPEDEKKCYTDAANVRAAPLTTVIRKGFYFDPTKNLLVKCSEGCDICTYHIELKKENCLQAQMNDNKGKFGLAFVDGLGVPQKCRENCDLCKGNATDADCLRWTGAYKFNPVTSATTSCDRSNCRYCNAKGECDKCLSGYGLAQNKTCQSCSSNCGECIYFRNASDYSAQACTKCNIGYYLNGNDCVRCTDENCGVCTGPSKCLACKPDSNLSPTGRCVLKSRLTNCKELNYDQSACTSCETGYYVNNQQCSGCSDTGCATCSGSGSDKCSVCTPGYFLKEGKNCGRCDSNCDTCTDATTCTKCAAGYFLNDKKACTKCAGNCATCETELVCQTCLPGFNLGTNKRCDPAPTCQLGQAINSKGECVSGTLDYCSLEDADKKTCLQPTLGYYVDPVTKKAANCPVGCGECQSDGKVVTCTRVFVSLSNRQVLGIQKVPGASDKVDYFPMPGVAYLDSPVNGSVTCAPSFMSYTTLGVSPTSGCLSYNQGCTALSSSSSPECYLIPGYSGGYTLASAMCPMASYSDGQTCLPCGEGCKYCRYEPALKAPSCLEAAQERYYISVDEKGLGVAKACATNCVRCKGPGVDDCFEYNSSVGYNYTFDPTLKTWGKCSISNCGVCKTEKVCSSCNPGYMQNATDNCRECYWSSYLKCPLNVSKPTECVTGYYLKVNLNGSTECTSCSGSGCLTCTGAAGKVVCTGCEFGYELFFGQCYSRSSSCLRFAAPELAGKQPKCAACRNDYYLKEDGSCSSCSLNTGCEACNDKGCVEAKPGYYITNEMKPEPCIAGCNSCKDAKTCISCATGWTKTAGDNPICQKCGDVFCDNCDGNFAICKRCRTAYTLSTDNKTCIGLESCPIGMAVQDGGTCVDMNVDYCIRGDYRGGKKICAVTTPGYYFDSTTGLPNSGKILPCPARCSGCALNAAGELKCTQTRALDNNSTKGYTLVPVFNAEKKQDIVDYKCPEGCAKCSQDGQSCITCMVGYKASRSNILPKDTIVRCVPKTDKCKASTGRNDDGCYDVIGDNTPVVEASDLKSGGFYDRTESAAKLCPEGCLECNWHFEGKKMNCLRPKKGYTLVLDAQVGVAIKCVDGCSVCKGVNSDADCLQWNSDWTYNPVDKKKYKRTSKCILASADNKCAKCEEGYGIRKDATCGSCGSGCGECIFYQSTNGQKAQCIRCGKGSYFDISTGSCVTCPTICSACSGAKTCLSCIDPLARPIDGACTKKYQCLERTEGGCTKCPVGYRTDPAQECVACQTGCADCKSATECKTCQPGYVLSGTVCKACSTPVGDCLTCSADLKCTACNAAAGLALQGDKCVRQNQCPDGQNPMASGTCGSNPFCKLGKDVSPDCRVPDVGYYFDGKDVKNCPPGCAKCFKSGEFLKCLEISHTDPAMPILSVVAATGASDTVRFNCPEGCASCGLAGCTSCATGYSLSYPVDLSKTTWPAATCIPNNNLASCIRFGDNSACLSIPGFFGEIPLTMAPCDAGAYPTSEGCKQCRLGCLECGLNLATGADTCYKPKIGYYLVEAASGTAETKSCATGCNVCTGPAERDCSIWQDSGYTWEPADQVYAKCPSNCDYCTLKGVCTACKPGYMEPQAGKCEKQCKDSNCAQCNPEGTCSKCRLGYGLSGTTCQSCSESSCAMCADPKKCDICKTGYYLTQKGTCRLPISACLTHNEDGTKCNTCLEGYYVTSSGTCSTCMFNCKACNADNSKCVKPNPMYFLKADKPAACGTGCIECEDEKTCKTCIATRRLKEDKTCESCKVSNCQTCEKSADTCTVCGAEAWPSADGKTCLSPRSCAPGQGMQEDGKCVALTWPNGRLCIYADLRPTKVNCIVSAPGFVYNPTKNDMVNCPARCRACYLDQNKMVKCSQILGAEGPTSTGLVSNLVAVPNPAKNADDVVYACPAGCMSCTLTGEECTSCKQGFEKAMIIGSVKFRCAEKKDGCSTYDFSNACFVDPNYAGPIDVSALPKRGQYFDGTGTQPCPSKCAECARTMGTTSATCTVCNSGYTLTATADGKAQQCVQCATGCNQCVGPAPNQCFELIPGFCWSTQLNRIAPCPSDCMVASTDNACAICKEGWTVQNDKCIPTDPNGCAVRLNNRCIKCFNEYWLKDDGTCQSCTDTVNCHACVRNGQCFICKNSTGITRSVTGAGCVACSEYCDSCETANTCKQCNPFTFKNSASKCQACSEYCTECTASGSCNTCIEGLELFGVVKAGDKCVACPINCQTCTQAGESAKCQTCMPGFVLDDKGECQACGKGCAKCDKDKCVQCAPNGIPIADSPKDCKLPSDCRPTWGLNLDEQGRCAALGIPYCLVGSFSKTKKDCFKTVDGYYWDGAAMKNCPAGCAACEYNIAKKYISCTRVGGQPGALRAEPAESIQDTLVGCTEGCATCIAKEPSKCLTCLQGFRLHESFFGGKYCRSVGFACSFPNRGGICFTDMKPWVQIGFGNGLLANMLVIIAAITFYLW